MQNCVKTEAPAEISKDKAAKEAAVADAPGEKKRNSLTDVMREKSFMKQDVELSERQKKLIRLKEISMFILPGLIAIEPVALPFGNPFKRDGENGILENWAYYFNYNLIGWGGLWIKIILWNCWIWKKPFFFPFMVGDKGIFEINGSLKAFLMAEVWVVSFYLLGYAMLENPVPWGTITFGVPSFAVQFLAIYLFVIPPERKKTKADHLKIIQVYLPFVLWVFNLIFDILIAFMVYHQIPKMKAENALSEVGGDIATMACFGGLALGKEFFIFIPHKLLMGSVDEQMGMLWKMGFVSLYMTFVLWLFPGMSPRPISVAGVLVAKFALATFKFVRFKNAANALDDIPIETKVEDGRSNVVDPRHELAFESGVMEIYEVLTEFWCVFSFLILFCYNCYGPNKQYMYLIDNLQEEDVLRGIKLILLNFGVLVVFYATLLKVMVPKLPEWMTKKLYTYYLVMFDSWYWLILWLIISTTLAAGACMIMKHDGMDLSFRFQEWEF